MTKEDARNVVFTPNDAVRLALKTIRERRTAVGAGVQTGVPQLDEYLLPARPGELIAVVANSANYKSGFMQWWARYAAGCLVAEEITDQCVIYVTWEQAIEEVLAFDMAATARISVLDILAGRLSDEEMRRLEEEVGPRRAMVPLYLIGHSVSEGEERPRLTLGLADDAVKLIRKDCSVSPRLILLDYLQSIEVARGEDRRMKVFYNVHACKDLALAWACPVVMGVQAGRRVLERPWAMPGMSDGEETSNIEHVSDKMLGLWMPKTKYGEGTAVSDGGKSLTVTENLLLVKVLKQRLGPAGRCFELQVDPSTNFVGPLTEEEESLFGDEEIPF